MLNALYHSLIQKPEFFSSENRSMRQGEHQPDHP